VATEAAAASAGPSGLSRLFSTERGRQKRELRDMQFRASRMLMENALEELRQGHWDEYEKRSLQARGGIARGGGTSAAEPTEHERYLDVRRVRITAFLLVALFAIVGLVLSKSSSSATATPYVSLLSGLAGIALGWMFAGSGGPVTRPRRRRQTGQGSASTQQ